MTVRTREMNLNHTIDFDYTHQSLVWTYRTDPDGDYWEKDEGPLTHFPGSALQVNTRTMTDVVTPNFEKLKSRGRIIMSPCSVVIEKVTDPVVFYKHHYAPALPTSGNYSGRKVVGWNGVGGRPLSRFLNLHGPYNDPSLKDTKGIAVTAAFANASAVSAQAIATIGEARQTVSLAADAFKKSYKVLKYLRNVAAGRYNDDDEIFRDIRDTYRRYSRNPSRARREIQNAWLAYRYGLRPLMHEIESYAEAIQKRKQSRRLRISGYSRDVKSKDETGTKTLSQFTATTGRHVKIEKFSRCVLYLDIDITPPSLFERFGFGDIPASAWELVPYSFIADWFLNTGDWFRGIQSYLSLDVAGSCVTTTTRTTETYEHVDWESNLSPDTVHTFSHPGQYEKYRETIDRDVGVKMPVLPSLNVRLDKTKLLDALALIGSQVR